MTGTCPICGQPVENLVRVGAYLFTEPCAHRILDLQLHQAHELAVRQNELYEAMQIVEQCGASLELTEAIVRLGERLRHIQADLVIACTQAGLRESR